ncbi:MAG: AAA family ATPase [Myxococcales bacterium]|nr:AAA family ATPase [Myxococcales bacterium]
MARRANLTLKLSNIGQIKRADLDLGDLTIFVGPQASGKSVALQAHKLAVDHAYIINRLRDFGFAPKDASELLTLMYGEGMGSIWRRGSSISFRGKPVKLSDTKRRRASAANVFYIPAHRTLTLTGGWPLTFQQHSPDTPFVAREYSEILRGILANERAALFPHSSRLAGALRELVDEAVFHGAQLLEERTGLQRQLKLSIDDVALSYMSWTAGQREFIPLLLGLYHLLPSQAKTKVREIQWVVIEEPEMGLHPKAVVTVMALALELLNRGYRVLISTHSPVVLDIVWAIRTLQQHKGTAKHVARLFHSAPSPKLIEIGESALKKQYRTYYFDFDSGDPPRVCPRDISGLDPGAADPAESGWGGVVGFSSHVTSIVGEVLESEGAD